MVIIISVLNKGLYIKRKTPRKPVPPYCPEAGVRLESTEVRELVYGPLMC